jgi:hypothetical protein
VAAQLAGSQEGLSSMSNESIEEYYRISSPDYSRLLKPKNTLRKYA